MATAMIHNGTLIFSETDYLQSCFSVFQDMKEKGESLDVVIKAKARSFGAHRVVLSGRIPYFREILSNDATEIILNEVDPEALESIINYAYEGKLKITCNNLQSMLVASRYFQLDEVHKMCRQYQEKIFDPAKELRSSAQASVNFVRSNYMIRENFDEFSHSKEFLQLPFSLLKEILTWDDLVVNKEEIVFERVIRWVQISLKERKHLLPYLLSNIRMAHLSPDYLIEKVATQSLIQASDQCKQIVEEAKSYHLLPNKRPMVLSFRTESRRYSSQSARECPVRSGIYAVFCVSPVGATVLRYDFQIRQWESYPTHSQNDQMQGVVNIKDKLYVFFGNSIETFDLGTFEWTTLDSTHETIKGSGIVSLMGIIYVFGGWYLEDKIRCFAPEQKMWLESDKMKQARRNMGAAASGKCIYLTGGYTTFCCNIFEKYHCVSKAWTEMPPLLCVRMDHASAVLSQKLYVCGGYSSSFKILDTAEVFDGITNTWTYISSLKIPRHSFSVVPWHRKLYAIGEMERKDLYLKGGMEIYSPETDKWDDGGDVEPELKNVPIPGGIYCLVDPSLKAVIVKPSND